MKRFHRMLVAPALLAALAAQPLAAQVAPQVAKMGERNAPASQQPSQDKDGAEARARLNAQQAQFAQNQVNTNSSSQEEYERQLQAVADAKARIAADQAAAQAAYQAEKARIDADYKAAMDRWQADVDACNAGVVARCAQPVATPPA